MGSEIEPTQALKNIITIFDGFCTFLDSLWTSDPTLVTAWFTNHTSTCGSATWLHVHVGRVAMAKKKAQAAQKSGGPKAPSGPNPYDSGLAELGLGWAWSMAAKYLVYTWYRKPNKKVEMLRFVTIMLVAYGGILLEYLKSIISILWSRWHVFRCGGDAFSHSACH